MASGGCDINLKVQQSTCFPSKSKVELKSGKKISMNELDVGDLVKTYSKAGEVKFSPVITFLDQDVDYKGYLLNLLICVLQVVQFHVSIFLFVHQFS